ncbi:peptide chain release factor N(5)-glutamine methyltransferase [Microbacterium lacus]|uniref:peptide chain release factor N(5)-glutamine methyltransferase n=1 Tax=Microbacterium lacus TaxID=415217 RepID=UPI000C2B6920|nr:peptide chain release factor N(5)-glutamine methyltransferase [Microbacterium lacus]
MPPSVTPSSSRALAPLLREAAERLAAAGIADPGVDVELLAAHVLGTSRGGVQAASIRGDAIEDTDAAAFEAFVERRAARVPLQHLTGLAPFRRLVLRVGPGVFVPRPETEIVAQFAIDSLGAAATPSPIAVDLGTGSGALALALATEVPHAVVYGVEKSPDAFIWAKGNAEFVGATNARIVRGDLDTALTELDGTVDVVVSNPPYVPDDAIPRDPEVRFHDPEAALYGGPDGLDVVRRVSRAALRLAHSGGTVVIEHGEWQGAAVRDILTADGWRAAATHPDLTMRDRATTALRP